MVPTQSALSRSHSRTGAHVASWTYTRHGCSWFQKKEGGGKHPQMSPVRTPPEGAGLSDSRSISWQQAAPVQSAGLRETNVPPHEHEHEHDADTPTRRH